MGNVKKGGAEMPPPPRAQVVLPTHLDEDWAEPRGQLFQRG